jgi:hypothetical protein
VGQENEWLQYTWINGEYNYRSLIPTSRVVRTNDMRSVTNTLNSPSAIRCSILTLLVFATASILFSTFLTQAVLAGNVVVGVNVVGANQLNEKQQDALLDQLQQLGVTTIRTGFGEQFTQFLIHANRQGIDPVAVVYPTHLGTNAHVRPPAPSVGLHYGQEPMTDADPSKFEPWFAAQLAVLKLQVSV